MTPRSRRTGSPPPLVALLALGSGCVTQALWEIEPESHLVVVAEHRAEAAVDVLADFDAGGDLLLDVRRAGDEPLPAVSGLVSARSFWRLEQEWVARGGGAAEARALLGEADGFEVQRVDVSIRRHIVSGEVTCQAELEVTARAVRPLGAMAIAPTALLPAAREAVGRVVDGDRLTALAPRIGDPDLLDDCARRLGLLDTRSWLPGGHGRPGRLLGCVWLDAKGSLLTDDARTRLLRDFAMDGRPGSHLAKLAELRLLAVVAGAEARELYVLRPDRVWLWSALDVDGDRVRHRSVWVAWPVAGPKTEGLVAVGGGAMDLEYLGGRIEEDVATNVAMKVGLTPVTIATDLVLSILRSWLVLPCAEDDRRGRWTGR